MAIIAKNKGGTDFDPMPAGNQHAVCYGVYDIGTQPSNNPKFRDKRQVVFTWEVPIHRIDIEKDGHKQNLPRAISRTFTLSLSEKSNLRPFLNSWRGRAFTEAELDGFDVSKVMGANALLNIIHETKDGKTYANVSSISPIMPSMAKLKPENPGVVFSLDDHKAAELPAFIPDWIKAKIMQSREWMERSQQPGHPPDDGGHTDGQPEDDNVPF